MLFSQLLEVLRRGNSKVLGFEVKGDPQIDCGESIELAKSNQITFIEKGSYLLGSLNRCKAGAILIPDENEIIDLVKNLNTSWAVLNDPRLGFAESLMALFPKKTPKIEIHSSANIAKSTVLEEEISIAPNVYIGEKVRVGKNTIIHPGVVIYDEVEIGENTELHANCVIHPKTRIGSNCIIHSNSVIGSEGFGFVPTKQGWFKMPQTGHVIIENNVEIGCNSAIDRPAVGQTLIGEGTKIDNLVQIGHGVTTGKGCAMAAQVGIAGGAKLGNSVILAGQVGIGNRVTVGDRVIASSKCGIHTDIEPGEVVSGFPAIPNRLWLRCSANFKRLPELVRSIKDLNRQKTNNLQN